MKNYYFFLLLILITNVSLAQWQKQLSGTSEDLNDVAVLRESTAIVIGNKGDNRLKEITETIDNLTAISFYNNLIGYCVGKNGTVLYTSSGDVSSVKEKYYPKSFNLYQNYLNPFNPETTIEFEIPQKEKVTIKIFDLLEKNISTLLNLS